MKEQISLNRSWLSGHFKDVAGFEVVIYTNTDEVCIEGSTEENSYYFDGDDGCQIIDQMTEIWLGGNCTQQGAVELWIRNYIL